MDSCQLFLRVREEFARRGLLGRAWRLDQGGRAYSIRCDQDCFTVYRINEKSFIPPGLPGWTVCRLSQADCFGQTGEGEACPLPQDDDHLAGARQWVEMVLACLEAQPAINSEERE